MPGGELVRQKAAVYHEQCRLLKELSEKSDCVIVGRCADYILSGCRPYRIFVYSDMESKKERCRLKGAQDKEFSDKELRHRILEVDKRRSDYYAFITGQSWGEKHNYDLCISTAGISVRKAASCMAQMLAAI